MKNGGWTDQAGNVFLFFPIKALAEVMHKSEMTIKNALRALEKEGLILRVKQGLGHPNRIYVKVPDGQTENGPSGRQYSAYGTDRKLSTNNNYQKQNRVEKQETMRVRRMKVFEVHYRNPSKFDGFLSVERG